MDIVTLSALEEELRLIKTAEKEKLAVDPVSLLAVPGMIAYGKVMATNAMNRYGHKIPAIRSLAREVAGVGARTAMQGKSMPHGFTRAVGAIAGDPKLMSIYEGAHAAAKRAKAEGVSIPRLHRMIAESGIEKYIPEAKNYVDFAKELPLKRGAGPMGTMRRVADYAFTPVKQVGKDLSRFAKKSYERAGLSKPELSDLYAKKRALNKLK